MTNRLTTILTISIALSSCFNNGRTKIKTSKSDSIAPVTKNTKVDSSTNNRHFTVLGDSIQIPSFQIEVSLSQKAKEKINNDKETIIVDVSFEGTPKAGSHAKLGDDGSFYLASARKEISYGQIARFDSISVPKNLYDQLANKDFDVDVNVYSGRRSAKNNLLNCEPLFDKINHVANKSFTLKGKLIYGDD